MSVTDSGDQLRDFLRSRRLAAGFSSRESLAKAMGWGARSITAYENGESLPSGEFLVAFAETTGADLPEVMRLWLEAQGKSPLARQLHVSDQSAAYTVPRNMAEIRAGLHVSTMPPEWGMFLIELVVGGKISGEAALEIADFFDQWKPGDDLLDQWAGN